MQQKEATIQLQNEKITFLKDQLLAAKSQSPDSLAQSLAGRVKLLEEELKRLQHDKSSTEEQIKSKESELREARNRAEDLAKSVSHAHELLSDFLCPYCGSPLAEWVHDSEIVEYKGRDVDVDHEYKAFECGFQLVDGEERAKCRNIKIKT